eukprot:CAMPEP_0196206970 /NCGR_PEP_ID=MMETSP0912-20130531/8131_1 /TAXON_ID=49265 /ORGANISM="Thalassiosira rotula, Strain GSO102" /LENGTH=93 /DNA_ID=CAMNT_0041481579 /DNA_START=219 /DNA_END=500 /DNA_ORIENTATION=-
MASRFDSANRISNSLIRFFNMFSREIPPSLFPPPLPVPAPFPNDPGDPDRKDDCGTDGGFDMSLILGRNMNNNMLTQTKNTIATCTKYAATGV